MGIKKCVKFSDEQVIGHIWLPIVVHVMPVDKGKGIS